MIRRKVECGAWARSTGQPCKAKALPNGRCRCHGGLSTGAKTPEGRAKSLANLVQYRTLAGDCSTVSVRPSGAP